MIESGVALAVSSQGYEIGTNWPDQQLGDDAGELALLVAISGAAFASAAWARQPARVWPP